VAWSGFKEKQYPGQLIFDYAPTATTKAESEAITNLQSENNLNDL